MTTSEQREITPAQWRGIREYVEKHRGPDYDITTIIHEDSMHGTNRVRVSDLLDAYDQLRAQLAAAEEAARIVYDARRYGCALVPVSHELLSAEWSHEPMHLKLEKNDDGTHLMKIKMSRELSELRTRAERAEAETDYIRRAFRGAVESDKLAITYQTIGSYRAGLLKTLNALDTTRDGGSV